MRVEEDDLPEDILFSQWFSDVPDTGEKRLCWGTLYDVFYVLLGPLPKDLATRKLIFRQREMDKVWINSGDKRYLHSFVSVCDLLGLSYVDVRRYLREAVATEVTIPQRYWRTVGSMRPV